MKRQRHGEPWNLNDISILVRMAGEGALVSEIAEHLDRTREATSATARRRGIKIGAL
ncbi:MAG: hypothetical protein JWR80_697 [Bradyrhizobium sp.]|nr:hypothetical protein [Bradyrhizobium sp.]